MNYKKNDLTSVQICSNISKINYKGDEIINKEFNDDWKNCLYYCSKISNIKTIKTIDIMLGNIKGKIISVYKKEKGVFVGCGYGVIENGFVGIFDIIVKEEYRRKGYGNGIVKTIIANAKENGIEKGYLTVVDNNIIAKRMYKNIGFNEIYKYWYRIKS